jgi:hypothetical protein
LGDLLNQSSKICWVYALPTFDLSCKCLNYVAEIRSFLNFRNRKHSEFCLLNYFGQFLILCYFDSSVIDHSRRKSYVCLYDLSFREGSVAGGARISLVLLIWKSIYWLAIRLNYSTKSIALTKLWTGYTCLRDDQYRVLVSLLFTHAGKGYILNNTD